MTPLRVWAPRAGRVEVEIDGVRRPLRAEDGGWWTLGAPLRPGQDYAFFLDGDGPLPDPASWCQPHGVHGPSRAVDVDALRWTDGDFRAPPLSSAVIEEIHVGTFTPAGTLDAAIGRLEELVDLGVTHVELMPLAAFPGRHGWGYDGVFLGAVHAPYGGPGALARFVDAAHGHGLAVLLDVVFNHLGPDGNVLPRFGPYLTDAVRTPWGDAVNLDQPGSDEVRAFFVDVALRWLRDLHVDGLRLDAVHALVDRSAVPFLEELRLAVDALAAETGRPFVLIAESDLHDPRVVTPVEAGGLGMDAQWSDDLHHALHVWLTGETSGYYADFAAGLDAVGKALRCAFVQDGGFSGARGCRHGRPIGARSGHRFLGYAQTHDQIGNRARGERLVHLVGPARARIAAAVTLLSPFVPLLFQGEAWGASAPFRYFTDHTDAALAEAVRHGRRREFAAFGWRPEDVPDPQDPATFAVSRLDWDERAREPHAGLLAWHRALIGLRRTCPELTDGRLDRVDVVTDAAGWLRQRRGRVTLVAHAGAVEARVSVGEGALRLASDGVRRDGDDVVVPPDGVAVVVR